MSKTLIENAPLVTAASVKASPMVKPGSLEEIEFRSPTKRPVSPGKWCTIACVLLAISGAIRYGRDLQFRGVYNESVNSPFPLAELPKVLGSWQAVEGSESQLDPETARTAGSSDHIIRDYLNTKSGERVSVFVLYGPAIKVFAHSPDACYPAAGYQTVPQSSVEGEIEIPGSATPAEYSKAYYVKNVGGASQYNEAVWTFRHDGKWLSDVKSQWKGFRYHPAMFKVQIDRPIMSIATESGPSETITREIIREIEGRLAARNAGKPVRRRQTLPFPNRQNDEWQARRTMLAST